MRRALCILAVAALAFGPSSAAAETTQRYEFSVTWSILPDLTLATGAIALEDAGEIYRMGMEAQAKVPFPKVDWKGFFSTEGRLLETGRAPALFQRRSESASRRERAVIVWDGEGSTPVTDVVETPPAPAFDGVDPSTVSPESIDPLTFLARIFDRVIETNGESCALVATTWDGVRLSELESVTGDTVQAARVDCVIRYRSIRGLPDVQRFEAKESATSRIVRFEKKLGRWRPVWIRIEGEFAGVRSTFLTTIETAE